MGSRNAPEDMMVVCTGCHVTVHQSCYGGSLLEVVPHDWLCELCTYARVHPRQEISCRFCPLGIRGPLKRLKLSDWEGYFWAHVQCVNWIPELYFSTEE